MAFLRYSLLAEDINVLLYIYKEERDVTLISAPLLFSANGLVLHHTSILYGTKLFLAFDPSFDHHIQKCYLDEEED